MAGPRTGRHAGQVRIQERVGNPGLKSNGGNISAFDQGKTRDIAAARAGLAHPSNGACLKISPSFTLSFLWSDGAGFGKSAYIRRYIVKNNNERM